MFAMLKNYTDPYTVIGNGQHTLQENALIIMLDHTDAFVQTSRLFIVLC